MISRHLEGQPARPPAGAENGSETIWQLEEQPARSLVGAENEAETLQQNDKESRGDGKSTVCLRWNHRLILFLLGICQAITRRNARCRTKVKIGKYCSRHEKE